jgi:hypothetical protein
VVMTVHDQLDSLSGPGIYPVVLVMIAAEMNSNNHGCSRREKYCREQKHGNRPSSQFHAENIADRDSQVQCSGPPILWSRTSTWNANAIITICCLPPLQPGAFPGDGSCPQLPWPIPFPCPAAGHNIARRLVRRSFCGVQVRPYTREALLVLYDQLRREREVQAGRFRAACRTRVITQLRDLRASRFPNSPPRILRQT